MTTQPLGLRDRLAPPPRDLDVLFWVNAGLIALFFSLLGSRFVLAPGLPVGVAGGLELPRTGTVSPRAAEVVVSYRRDNMILFEGGVYELANFRGVLERYARSNRGAAMIVRVDRQVSMQGFVDLCEIARAAGFAYVQVAAEPAGASGPDFVPARR